MSVNRVWAVRAAGNGGFEALMVSGVWKFFGTVSWRGMAAARRGPVDPETFMKTYLFKWLVLGVASSALLFSAASCKQEQTEEGAEVKEAPAEGAKEAAPAEKEPAKNP